MGVKYFSEEKLQVCWQLDEPKITRLIIAGWSGRGAESELFESAHSVVIEAVTLLDLTQISGHWKIIKVRFFLQILSKLNFEKQIFYFRYYMNFFIEKKKSILKISYC